MKKCILYTWVFVIMGILIMLALNCRSVESFLFQCPECVTHCTPDNAVWGFLILSLPAVLFIQYIMDDDDNRGARIVYQSAPVVGGAFVLTPPPALPLARPLAPPPAPEKKKPHHHRHRASPI